MINLISTFGTNPGIGGSAKVFANLVKGLNKIGYPYVVNRDLNAASRLWIHNDVIALRTMGRSQASKVVGPNLFVMPQDILWGTRFDGALYLQPSEWAKTLWQREGFNACPIKAWPVGIDTDAFQPSTVPAYSRRIMVYHKQRDGQELADILTTLQTMHLPCNIIMYGDYIESDYKQILAQTSFIIWHGCHESQGIALQEAMAGDIPVLVCDVTSLSQIKNSYYQFSPSVFDFPVTAAPYFNQTCGVKIADLHSLKQAIEKMQDELTSYRPRDYVVRNLSLEKQARAFVDLWEYWGLTYEMGFDENLVKNTKWHQPLLDRLAFKAQRRLERMLKRPRQ